MYFMRKLKPPQFTIEWAIGLSVGPMVIVICVVWGMGAMFVAVAIIEFLVTFLQINLYFRTKNSAFILMGLTMFIIGLLALLFAITGFHSSPVILFAFIVFIAFFIIIYVTATKKVKWRTRELLELAAMPVSDTKNGFTERPLPSGKVDGTKKEIDEFAQFLMKNLIVIPYFENVKIIFSLTSSFWKQSGLKLGYSDESWVSFGLDGNVVVSITKNDYLRYNDLFTFDQLCISLGNLFIEFFEMFKRGDGVRIIDRLNALRLNPFTE